MRNRPVRIQRTRQHPYMSPNLLETVYVGRPSRWGNPYKVNEFGKKESLQLYEQWLLTHFTKKTIKKELGGKNLACWCALNEECHADVLLKLANESTNLSKV